nr:type VI secretion system tip protein TssI/VgrG [Morganella morganii]
MFPGQSGLVFTCKIGRLPEQTFQVTEFSLSESLSSLFSLTISAVSQLPSITFEEHLGSAASLTVTRDGVKVRTVQGLLASAEQGNTDGNKTWYHFLIRPEMWIMTLNQDSRIFQKQSVPEVLATLLDEAHVKNELKFYQDELHQKRDYITQKRESAYEFWCRLAAEEGINFWFEEGPKLFYSDNHLGMTAGIDLAYNPQADTDISDSTAFSWRYAEQLCGDIQIHKDYNPQNPSYPLQHQITGEVHQQHSTFESYGRFQQDVPGQPFTQLRYEQSQNQRQTGTAGTNCFALMPGKIFTLKNHPSDSMNKAWQVIMVNHHGIQPLADNSGGEGTKFSNTVQFIPGTREWRPPYRFRPQADGDELATVVGPEGEEIYTNEQGAVKVYFHWDRYGNPDHSASCWVRVAHGWNGDGFGFMSIPRIGQEVIVSYLSGDIDRPIITGCTYNGRNNPPLNLPKEKTRTTFRTRTHKGDGFNELRFEDSAGIPNKLIRSLKNKNDIYIHHGSPVHFYEKTVSGYKFNFYGDGIPTSVTEKLYLVAELLPDNMYKSKYFELYRIPRNSATNVIGAADHSSVKYTDFIIKRLTSLLKDNKMSDSAYEIRLEFERQKANFRNTYSESQYLFDLDLMLSDTLLPTLLTSEGITALKRYKDETKNN